MQKRSFTRIIAFSLAAMCVFALAGCAAPQQSAQQQDEDAVTQNRQYMSELNQNVGELSSKLDGFVDAATRGDVVTMQSQADNAFKVITNIESLQAPDDLEDLKTGYTEACGKLRGALNDYIALYSEITASLGGDSFDFSTYNERINSIQQQYNEAIAQLESTDNTATELKK